MKYYDLIEIIRNCVLTSFMFHVIIAYRIWLSEIIKKILVVISYLILQNHKYAVNSKLNDGVR
jgi:hypothetical protein